MLASNQPVSAEILCNKFGLLEWPVLEGSGPVGLNQWALAFSNLEVLFKHAFIHSRSPVILNIKVSYFDKEYLFA